MRRRRPQAPRPPALAHDYSQEDLHPLDPLPIFASWQIQSAAARGTQIQSPEKSTSVCKTSGGGGRACSWPWFTEKDNHHQRDAEKMPKALSITGGGGAKSFMVPTISGASKAVAASALMRKKVLGECNNDLPQEQLHHHPIPLSPGKMAHNKPVCRF